MVDLPLPVAEGESQPFWDALSSGELRVQRCRSCLEFRQPPRAMCGACGSFEAEWAALSGRGTVYTYNVSHQAIHPALADRVPFATVVVELEEGPRLTSNLVDVAIADIAIGMPVELELRRVSEEVTLPFFRPTTIA
jgi:uncharacterized protein